MSRKLRTSRTLSSHKLVLAAMLYVLTNPALADDEAPNCFGYASEVASRLAAGGQIIYLRHTCTIPASSFCVEEDPNYSQQITETEEILSRICGSSVHTAISLRGIRDAIEIGENIARMPNANIAYIEANNNCQSVQTAIVIAQELYGSIIVSNCGNPFDRTTGDGNGQRFLITCDRNDPLIQDALDRFRNTDNPPDFEPNTVFVGRYDEINDELGSEDRGSYEGVAIFEEPNICVHPHDWAAVADAAEAAAPADNEQQDDR